MKIRAIIREFNPFYEFSIVRDVSRRVKNNVLVPLNYLTDRFSGSYAPRSFSRDFAEKYNQMRFDHETSWLHEKHAKQDEKLMAKIAKLKEKFDKKLEKLKQKLSADDIDKKKAKFEKKIEKMHNRLTKKQMNEWGKIVDRDQRRTAITLDRYM